MAKKNSASKKQIVSQGRQNMPFRMSPKRECSVPRGAQNAMEVSDDYFCLNGIRESFMENETLYLGLRKIS